MPEKELVLYADLASQPCRAVFAFLLLADIPFRMQRASILRGAHKQLDFNLLGTLPFITDQHVQMSESNAILTYLVYTRKCTAWMPSEAKAHALCQQYLHWHHSGLRSFGYSLYYSLALHRSGKQVSPGSAEQLWQQGCQSLQILNTWLESRLFLTGDHISIADLSAVCELAQLQLVPGLLQRTLAQVPRVESWFGRVYNIPQVKAAHAVLERISEKLRQASKL